MTEDIPLQVFKQSSMSSSLESVPLSTPVDVSAASLVPPTKPPRKFGLQHNSTDVARFASLPVRQDIYWTRSRYSFTNDALMRVMFAEVKRPHSWNGTPSDARGSVHSRCASETQLAELLLDRNYGFRPLSTYARNRVQNEQDSISILSKDSTTNFCRRSQSSVKLSRFTGDLLKVGQGSSYSVNVEVFSGPGIPKKNELCLTSEVALNAREQCGKLDDYDEPIYMNLGHFRSENQALIELVETSSATYNMEESFLLANAFANQALQYKWISTFPNILPPPGWKQAQNVLMVCLHNVNVPTPRERLFAEFPDFSRDQVTLFSRIFHTFTDDDCGLFRMQELTFLMSRLGNPLDTLSLTFIFEQADKTNRGNILVEEFIQLFRLACQDQLFDVLNIFKMIAQQVKAHSLSDGTFLVVRDIRLQTELVEGTTQTETNIAPRGVRRRFLNTVSSALSYIVSKFH